MTKPSEQEQPPEVPALDVFSPDTVEWLKTLSPEQKRKLATIMADALLDKLR